MNNFTKLWQLLMVIIITSSVLVLHAQKMDYASKKNYKVPEKNAQVEFLPEKVMELKGEELVEAVTSLLGNDKIEVLGKEGFPIEKLGDLEYQKKAQEILKDNGLLGSSEPGLKDGGAKAMASYSFAQSAGTYSEITGTVSTATGDDGGQNITLPFGFVYDGQNYITARISTNGWLEMGQTYTSSGYTNDLASTTYKPLICGLWDDLYDDDNGDIQYTTTGTSPNQVFTVQWTNVLWGRYTTGTALPDYRQNFQIKLYEGTNVIEIIYGTLNTPGTERTPTASIGLNDAIGGVDHFLSVTPGSPATVSSTVANNGINAITDLASGTTFTFTPPLTPTEPYGPIPANAASDIAVSTNLAWNFGANTDTYDVFFGTDNPPATKVVDNAAAVTPLYDPPADLSYNTTYYWQVVAHNSYGNAEGAIWSFTTGSDQPYPPTSPMPANAATSVSIATNLEWTFGINTETYDVLFGTDNPPVTKVVDNAAAGAGLYDPPADLANNTTYYWQVIARNAAKGEAAGPIWSFKTACGSESIPWEEGFEGLASVGSGIVPDCMAEVGDWYSANTSNSYNRQARTGTNYMYTNYGADDWLFTPAFDLDASTSYDFSFWFITDGLSGWTTVEAMYGTGQTSGDMTVTIGTPLSGPTNTSYTEYKGTFTPASSGTYYIGIHVVANYVPWYISFDDLALNLTPDCPAPGSLTATNITGNSADIGWTSAATAWEYVYGMSPVPEPTGAGTATSSNPTSLSGLSPSTSYDFWVRASCDGGLYSTWAGPYTFTTGQVPATLPYFENFEAGNMDDWTVVNGTQTNAWYVGDATAYQSSYSVYISNDNGISNTYTNDVSSVVHFYRDITFPGGPNPVGLNFAWKANAESCCDYLRVFLVDLSTQPVAGVVLSSANQIGGTYNIESDWVIGNIELDPAVNGTTKRLVFSWRNDGSVGTDPPAAVDNISLSVISCPTPTDLMADNIGTTSADLSWTETGTATTWDIEYGEAPYTFTGTPTFQTTSNPHSLSVLTAATTYSYKVRAVCGVDDESSWSEAYSFTTLCDIVTSFSENFDASTSLPNCWTKIGGGSGYVSSSNSNSAPNCLYIYGYSGAVPVVTMPEVSNASAETHQLRFLARSNSTAGAVVDVGYMTDPADPLTFTLLQSFTTTLSYSEYTCLPGTAPGANTVLAFRQPETPGYSASIDDVQWEEIPTCPIPTNLMASNIGTTSADLSWTENGTATTWDVEYGEAPYTFTGTPSFQTTSNPHSLSGLTAATTYSFKVRAVCGVGNESPWSASTDFTTSIVNDDCLDAIVVACDDVVTGTTIGATVDVVPVCIYTPTSPGVWYKYVGDGNGVEASLCSPNTDFDTRMNVYSGTCGDLICVDGDDDGCTDPGLASVVSWVSEVDVEYYILVYGYSSNTGNFELTINCTPPAVANISPTSFSQTIPTNSTATDNLSIGNTGGLPLNYSATIDYGGSSIFSEDFEGGTLPAGWLAIDNDGDGFNWINTIEQGNDFDAHSGDGAMTSASFDNTAGVLTPDNWLITPAIAIGASPVTVLLNYWHDAQDPFFPDDFYYVKVSTTGTALTDFTETVWSGVTPQDWEMNSINLDAYKGQTIYIAFQHTDCTDEFWMKIDDVDVTEYSLPIGWLSLDGGTSSSGTVLPGDPAADVVVGFESTGLAVGTYNANVIVYANDATGTYTLPVTLIVRLPEVAGTLFYGETDTKPIGTDATVTLTPDVPPGPPINLVPNVDGSFTFSDLDDGTYLLTGSTTKVWGGLTTFDATLILRFVGGVTGYDMLTNLQKRAADVNMTNTANGITTFDATIILRTAAAGNVKPPQWTAPDFLFDGPYPSTPYGLGLDINVTGTDVNQNLRTMCSGDVNGSYNPPAK